MKKFILMILLIAAFAGISQGQTALKNYQAVGPATIAVSDIFAMQKDTASNAYAWRKIRYDSLRIAIKQWLDDQAITWTQNQIYNGSLYLLDSLNLGGGKFVVDPNGNITKINNIGYNWPATLLANGKLKTDDLGNLTWDTTGAAVGGDVYLANDNIFTGSNINKKSTNAVYRFGLYNRNTGGTASTQYVIGDTLVAGSYGGLTYYNSNHDGEPFYLIYPSRLALFSTGVNGLGLAATNINGEIHFFTSGSESGDYRGKIDKNGNFSWGGGKFVIDSAGYITKWGNITFPAFSNGYVKYNSGVWSFEEAIGGADTANYAIDILNGAANKIPYQTGVNVTSFIDAPGGTGRALAYSATNTFSWLQYTNANTASTIVQRDASGNFLAGTITATLAGNATTATTSTNIAGGLINKIPIQSAANTTTFIPAPTDETQVLAYGAETTFGWINLRSTNTANSVVYRDGSGNFSAGTITATFSGNLTGNVTGNVSGSSGSCTGNAATVTNGVYTSGSYANPSWITSLAYSKVTGMTVDKIAISSATGVLSVCGVSSLELFAPAFGEMYDNGSGTSHNPNNSWVAWTSSTTGNVKNLTYDATNDKLTVSSAGYYKLDYEMHFTGNNAGVSVYWCLYKNGSTELSKSKSNITIHAASELETISGTCYYSLSASDYIQLKVYTSTSQTITTYWGNVNITKAANDI